jgi:hypothetical protein
VTARRTHRPLRRSALALAAAGLLLAGVCLIERQVFGGTAGSKADPTFDPLLDGTGAPICGPLGGIKPQALWTLAAVTKTETAPSSRSR